MSSSLVVGFLFGALAMLALFLAFGHVADKRGDLLLTHVSVQSGGRGYIACGRLLDGTLAVAWGRTRHAALSELYAHQLADCRPEGDEKHNAPPLEVLERSGDEPAIEIAEAEEPAAPPPVPASCDATFRGPRVIPLRAPGDATFRAPAAQA